MLNNEDIPRKRANQAILVIINPHDGGSIPVETRGRSSLKDCKGSVSRKNRRKNISGDGLLLKRFLRITSLSNGKKDKKVIPAMAQVRSEASAG
ncbi:MAG: hypothetical protein KAH21_11690, partial [Spirochaetaceae bacterium]|nr:hypothetical protein [Spirochaetaceae bacterium]